MESTRARILIIDDEEGIREVLTDILRTKGYEVTSADSGEQGLKEVSQSFFGVVILDIHLPDMTGMQILDRIEQLSPDTQVIIVTAYASVDTAIEAVHKRAYDYISKPFKIEKLVDSVEGAIERQRLTAENKRMLSQLKFLNAIADKLMSTLDLDSILGDILDSTLDFLSIKTGAIYIQDGAGWILRKHRGVSDKFVSSFGRLGEDHPVVREAISFRTSLPGESRSEIGFGTSWAALPLQYRERPYGIMVLAGKKQKALGPEERRVLAILGAQAGSAIYNALLYRGAEQTKNYLEGLIYNTADAISTYDLMGRVRTWNPAAAALFGFAEHEAVGRVLVSVPAERLKETMDSIQRVKAGEIVVDFETERVRKDRTIIPVSVTYSPIRDSTGEVVGISAVSRDLTMKKRIEEERIKTKILEARGRIREVMMDVVPLLLRRRLPEEDRDEFISILSKKLEDALYDDYLGGLEDISASVLGERISQVLNDMGGSFVSEAKEDEVTIVGIRCPWDNESKRNPVTCMLTKSIASRFAKRAWGSPKVHLSKTLANRDDSCVIVVSRQREENSAGE